MIDVQKARDETPGAENVLHFNNAGAALMPRIVVDAIKGHIDLEAKVGGYEAADKTRDADANMYKAIANLINCESNEVAFVENATVGWSSAFYGLASTFKPGDRILTTQSEYSSNYIAYLQIVARTGIQIGVIPNDETGALSPSALENMIDDRVKLISITHIPTNGGLTNPAAAVGKIANMAGIPYLLDACQSVGQMPINVSEIGCDFLSATGRKYLRGPRGTGFLYASAGMIEKFEPPVLDNHAATWTGRDTYEIRKDAKRFENWENFMAGKVALGVAIDYANALGLDHIYARNLYLSNLLRDVLSQTPGVTVRDLGANPCAIVTFTVDGINANEIKARMNKHKINITHSTLFSTRLDMENRNLNAVVRASLHYYNTEEEIDRFINILSAEITV
jgi:cysteine desulfurase/selenocysteine lyase